MKIIEPSVILENVSSNTPLLDIERFGRTCYKSEDNIIFGSAEKFVKMLIKNGHESVLEHINVTLRFICDRGVTHELVRHRLASYSQESTIYCNYSNKDIEFVKPCFWDKEDYQFGEWDNAMRNAEYSYNELINNGASPQEARSTLPNSLKTEIIVTANLREWRHILRLRLSKASHPQMRQVMEMAYDILKNSVPVIFDDLDELI